MTAKELLPRLRFRLGDAIETDETLLEILTGSIHTVRALTWCKTLPEEAGTLIVKLAVIAFNRMGIEGEASRTEGSVARVVTAIPDDIYREIIALRKAKVGY